MSVLGVPIPDFDRVLEIAVRATDQTGLGYVGADVVVDARLGPVILEMNARPGLAIQLANRAGLLAPARRGRRAARARARPLARARRARPRDRRPRRARRAA